VDLATHQSRESQTIDRTVLASAPPGNPTGEPDGAGVVQEEKGATGSAIFLIRLADAPLASYRGNHPDLPAASPEATGACLSLQSRANQAYLQYRKTRRGDFKSCAQRALARTLDGVCIFPGQSWACHEHDAR
jgi:hypothetical protein